MMGAGGGGLSASSSATGRSGDAGGASGTGSQTFNFGGNPALNNVTSSPLLLFGAIALIAWLYFRSKGK
jgi:hypothetical protein